MHYDPSAAAKPPKLIHRERVPGGPVVSYYRAGLNWQVYWRSEDAGSELTGEFASLVDARLDAEATLTVPVPVSPQGA